MQFFGFSPCYRFKSRPLLTPKHRIRDAVCPQVRRELVTFKQHLDGRDQVTSSAMHTLTQKVEHARAALEAVTRLMQAKEEEASRPLGNKRGPLVGPHVRSHDAAK